MVAIALDPTTTQPIAGPNLHPVPRPAGRRPVSLLLGAVAAVALVLAGAYLVLSPPLADPGTIPVEASYVVEGGDSMWSIAQTHAPAGEAATYVERLVELNGTSRVEAGQVVQLPRS